MEDVLIFCIFFLFSKLCQLVNNFTIILPVNLGIVLRNPEAGKNSEAVLSAQQKKFRWVEYLQVVGATFFSKQHNVYCMSIQKIRSIR